MWLPSLLWVEKGKGRRHLGVTWNRGQLMIQFREAFLLSLRLGIFAAASQVVSNRHHSTLAHCSALPVRPDVASHAWLSHCSLHLRYVRTCTLLCATSFMHTQHDYAACHESYLGLRLHHNHPDYSHTLQQTVVDARAGDGTCANRVSDVDTYLPPQITCTLYFNCFTPVERPYGKVTIWQLPRQPSEAQYRLAISSTPLSY